MTRTLEKRFLHGVRAETRGSARRLVGYAARYGAVADLGDFRERIAPGAFAGSIGDGGDILALFDHDPKSVLGRTRTKTLQLTDDSAGLAFDILAPDTSAGRDALALAERGDLGGASIGFFVEKETRDGDVRVVEEAQLLEISVVSSWPAYEGTSVEARRRGVFVPLRPRLGRLRRYLDTV